jgi:hypothetical protein
MGHAVRKKHEKGTCVISIMENITNIKKLEHTDGRQDYVCQYYCSGGFREGR